MQTASKLRQFTRLPDSDRICPHYSVMTRAGRTSCGNPNLQQVPRDGGFRECYVGSDGHFLLTIDYSYIELVTLASICLLRFGFSRLAEVIPQRRGSPLLHSSVNHRDDSGSVYGAKKGRSNSFQGS